MTNIWKVDVEVTGFDRLRRKIKADPPLVAPIWREVVEQAGQIGVREAQQRAPRGKTGKLATSLVAKMQNKPMPAWLRVSNTARARGVLYKRQSKRALAGQVALKYTKGYSYPGRQAWDQQMPHYGWFQIAMRATQARIQPLLSEAARKIEAEWGRK